MRRMLTFIAGENSKMLVRNMWPKGHLVRLRDDPADLSHCYWWQVLPRDPEELSSWFEILPKQAPFDPSRPFIVTTASDVEDPEGEERTMYEAELRIQGILGKHNLAPLGNWNL